MDDFYNYAKYKTFWWNFFLQYAEFICAEPHFQAKNGFVLGDYLKTKEGKTFQKKFDHIAWN